MMEGNDTGWAVQQQQQRCRAGWQPSARSVSAAPARCIIKDDTFSNAASGVLLAGASQRGRRRRWRSPSCVLSRHCRLNLVYQSRKYLFTHSPKISAPSMLHSAPVLGSTSQQANPCRFNLWKRIIAKEPHYIGWVSFHQAPSEHYRALVMLRQVNSRGQRAPLWKVTAVVAATSSPLCPNPFLMDFVVLKWSLFTSCPPLLPPPPPFL